MKNIIKFLGITALVTVMVFGMAGCASMTVVDVEWDTLEAPGKARQYLGLSASEVKVYAHYKNGERRQASASSLGYNKDTAGTQTVKAYLGKGSGSFQCEVMPLTGIRMISPPTKTAYTVGDSLDISGLKVMGMWNDMPEAEIPFLTLLLAKTNFNSGTPGNKVVSLDYKGYSVTFPVTVNAKAEAAAAPAASQPAAQQPAQQQQPAAQQPAQQQPAQSTSEFKPAANQPAPTGTWRLIQGSQNATITFNANGTATQRLIGNGIDSSQNFTWSASGNRLTMTMLSSRTGEVLGTVIYIYGISGNSMTMQVEGETAAYTWTRQ